jgi:hydrogenase maturation protease
MGDDGAGLRAVALLAETDLPAQTRLVTAGTDVLRIADLWRGEERVWLADALAGGAPPGTVHRLDHDRLLQLPQRHDSAHHLSLPESLRWMRHARPALRAARYRLWGIEPARVAPGTALSREVAAAAAAVAREILAALADG